MADEIRKLTREETWQRLIELGAVEGELPPALTPEEIARGKRYAFKSKSLDNAELKGADLRFFNLSGAVLNRADLSGAWLWDARFISRKELDEPAEAALDLEPKTENACRQYLKRHSQKR